MRHFFIIGLLLATSSYAYELNKVEVSGSDLAVVKFSGQLPEAPAWKIQENLVEFTLAGTKLNESYQGRVDLDSPHTLIRRVSLYPVDGNLKAKLVINGTMDEIKNRIHFKSVGNTLEMTVNFPKSASASLNLLKEEQMPLASTKAVTAEKGKDSSYWFVVMAVILCAGLVSFIIVKVLKSKGKLTGTRRYLIEQMGYCALGPKTGVSLLRVGKEFILVGVTSNQVNILSSLPKLQEQYEEESRFERGVFKDAIQEQVNKLG